MSAAPALLNADFQIVGAWDQPIAKRCSRPIRERRFNITTNGRWQMTPPCFLRPISEPVVVTLTFEWNTHGYPEITMKADKSVRWDLNKAAILTSNLTENTFNRLFLSPSEAFVAYLKCACVNQLFLLFFFNFFLTYFFVFYFDKVSHGVFVT